MTFTFASLLSIWVAFFTPTMSQYISPLTPDLFVAQKNDPVDGPIDGENDSSRPSALEQKEPSPRIEATPESQQKPMPPTAGTEPSKGQESENKLRQEKDHELIKQGIDILKNLLF
jgi:hypothetical protein